MADSLELRDVSVTLGRTQALQDVRLTVEPGERVAVVGPSGAGKTTLLRVMGGALLPTRGRALIGNQDPAQLSSSSLRAVRSRMGFIHQDHSLVPIYRVLQNVLSGRLGQLGIFASLRSMLRPSGTETASAFSLLERVGIPEKLYERTDTLSGGQQQRVAMARALYQQPNALLADEPIASVDPARGRALMELLLQVAEERQLTLVASLHDLPLALDLFPRLVGLRGGRIVLDKPTGAIVPADLDRLYDLRDGGGGDA